MRTENPVLRARNKHYRRGVIPRSGLGEKQIAPYLAVSKDILVREIVLYDRRVIRPDVTVGPAGAGDLRSVKSLVQGVPRKIVAHSAVCCLQPWPLFFKCLNLKPLVAVLQGLQALRNLTRSDSHVPKGKREKPQKGV